MVNDRTGKETGFLEFRHNLTHPYKTNGISKNQKNIYIILERE